MSLVTYTSTHATASGVSYLRDQELDFGNKSANLYISYDTNQINDLIININVPGYFQIYAQEGTISWVGDKIHFDIVHGLNVNIDVNFSKGELVPGVIPLSLNGLEGITGNFSATVQSSVGVHYPYNGFIAGTAVSAPEPSSYILFIMGIIGLFIWRKYA